ncbi:MAG: D-tyrosyl-tRNA(Tyr) deacylase [Deltaproteobacteria bacterium]|nr:D-tyrosyl-tRNA(Tyr) deacylase [Deltaproteobacteria bacterium]
MITVLQRVSKGEVTVDGETRGFDGPGVCALIAITVNDTEKDVTLMASKIVSQRIFSDQDGRFNFSVKDVKGSILAVSNFTVAADTSRGNRPSFSNAMPGENAQSLFSKLLQEIEKHRLPVFRGVFGAHMDIHLVNDGPVTVIIDTSSSGDMKKSDSNSKHTEKFRNDPDSIIEGALLPLSWNNFSADEKSRINSLASGLVNYELLRKTLDMCLLSESSSSALSWLQKSGVFKALVPEIEEMVFLSSEDDRRHKHVWDHTLQVVKQTPPQLEIRYAALFHDIGKARTRKFEPDGKVTFYGHDSVGARMFWKISKKLGLSKEFTEYVAYLIRNHLRPGQYSSDWTSSAVRRFDRETRENMLEDLLELGRADITSKRPGRREDAVRLIDELYSRILEIRETDNKLPPLPKGLGNEIMNEFKLRPGPVLGIIKNTLEQQIIEGNIEPFMDSSYYISRIKNLFPEIGDKNDS